MMPLKLAAASVLALSVAGCGSAGTRGAAALTGRLDCPERQGELTRLSAAADGKSCVYRIADGAEVTLRLLPVANGDPGATLSEVEKQLRAEAQGPGGPMDDKPAGEPKATAEAARIKAEAAADAAQEAQDAAEEARDSTQTWDDKSIEARVNAKLREKGLNVDEDHHGDRTHVDMPGLHIDADDSKDQARVDVGPLHIDANGDTATVRSSKRVRLRGEGLSRERRGYRAMYIYAGDDLAGGYKYVGYEAAGPKDGPLTVAVVGPARTAGTTGSMATSMAT